MVAIREKRLKIHPYDVVTTCLEQLPETLSSTMYVVSFLVIPKLNLGLLHAHLWVRDNPGCLMAKEGCPHTLVHHCSF